MMESLDITGWSGPFGEAEQARAVECLEVGKVLAFPALRFPLDEAEQGVIRLAGTDGSAKNISLDPATGECKGSTLTGDDRIRLAAVLERFARSAMGLILGLMPFYQPGLTRGRTSFRPVEIAGRQSSWRQDDKRLHVDAFPTRPLRGQRILRLFANIDHDGVPRYWRVGPDFESYATQFLPGLRPSIPGQARLLRMLGLTKAMRSRYDEVMLHLHDAAKRDMEWQGRAGAVDVDFPAGSAWAVFTDQVPHAALSGRNALEQTFYIDPHVLARPGTAPLAVLERLCGQAMV
ncbi:MAG TPA: Kdo hydroxylase family protein [Acetobacteraceae bacterium]|nr:Kdo hydroxylase family protein [Acetobacteraceae bacterium]